MGSNFDAVARRCRAVITRVAGPSDRRRLLGAVLVVTVVVGALAVSVAAPASAEVPPNGPTYQVVNTGGIGVALRAAPNTNSARSQGPGERASFTLLCQEFGTPVGGARSSAPPSGPATTASGTSLDGTAGPAGSPTSTRTRPPSRTNG